MDTSTINFGIYTPNNNFFKPTGPLYITFGYCEDEAPLEIKPSWGELTEPETLINFKYILGKYAGIIARKPDHTSEVNPNWMFWDEKTGYYQYAGMWKDDYLYIGEYWDLNDDDPNFSYDVEYITSVVISRELFDVLRWFIRHWKEPKSKYSGHIGRGMYDEPEIKTEP